VNRKTAFLLALVVIATLLLAACGGGATGPAGPTGPQAKSEEPTAAPAAPAQAEEKPAAEPTKAEEPKAEPTKAAAPTAVPTAAAAAAGDVPSGYYNLADFAAKTGAKFEKYGEAPMLADRVAKGDLPAVEERLPTNPLVYRTMDKVGQYGGTLRFDGINIDQDWHLRHINSANLIEMPADAAWDAVSTVYGAPQQPGIFEKWGMNEDGTKFTATIREGLKWSDGTPVTTEDVKFRINDVLLNKELNPTPMPWLTWGGGETKLEVVDDRTFGLTFAKPYGSFIEAEIRMWPGTFYKMMYPAHFLKQYHKDYVPEDELLAKMKEEKYTSIGEWPQFFGTKTALFGVDNPYMDNGKPFPTLNPYVFVEDQGNGNMLLERNPYFYMVDQEGNQLPYIDKLQRNYVSDAQMQDMNIVQGKTDMSCMSIGIDSYPLYKENEANGKYKALLLNAWQDQIFIMGFNDYAGIKPLELTSVGKTQIETPAEDSAYDPGLSEVYSDLRFRQAMSIALDRKAMNEALFLGKGRPAQVAPRPGTPFYEEGMEEAWAQYDPDKAKALLDEMGMKDVDGDGWRERPDGKKFSMKYDYFVITGASTPGSELAKRYWEEVGVKVDLKLVDVQYWWGVLQPNNINEATTWWLAGSGANLLQDWFLGPSMLNPLWNNYTRYKGLVSDEDWQKILEYVPEWQREMQDLKLALKSEPDEQKRIEIGKRMWELQRDNLAVIGVATDTKTPMIVSEDLDNVWMAEDKGYNYITMMEGSEGWFFKNPDRLK
jgi:peptide/nickel transport system substrate-binding protein